MFSYSYWNGNWWVGNYYRGDYWDDGRKTSAGLKNIASYHPVRFVENNNTKNVGGIGNWSKIGSIMISERAGHRTELSEFIITYIGLDFDVSEKDLKELIGEKILCPLILDSSDSIIG